MDNYHFNLEKAKLIHNNSEELEKELNVMSEAFKKQGNEAHSLECHANYNNALFMEKVFYEELVPKYQTLKTLTQSV